MTTTTRVAAAAPETTDPFTPTDWGLLATAAGVWGASFLFIAVGLEAFHPVAVGFLRLCFGAGTLACVPRARRGTMPAEDLRLIALLGVIWMAIPLTLFPLAEQTVDSSVAGMINGAVPVTTAAVGALMTRRLPRGVRLAGILVGFAGIVAIGLPSAVGAQASLGGVGLLVLAVCLYGCSLHLAVPLQRRYGSLPVLLRAELVAVALLAVPGGLALRATEPDFLGPLLAIAVLGCAGTALAFVAMTTLAGRVGADRASVAIYLTPVVAIVLGVTFLGESVAPLAMAGTVLVIAGAYLASRRARLRPPA